MQQQTQPAAEKSSTVSESAEAIQNYYLTEKEDFIQFKEMLRTIGDDSIDRLNVQETLSFISKLCERLLLKTGSIELEDRNVIKLSLSIFFSLLLVDVPLL